MHHINFLKYCNYFIGFSIPLHFRFYHQKLTGLQKEMMVLSDRSANMKARALKLLDAKQDEALR